MRSPWDKPDEPTVVLDLYKHLTIDLRAPPAVPSTEIREAIDAHKERRAKEQAKVEPALYYPRTGAAQNEFGSVVELHTVGPLDVGPLEPPDHACDGIDCLVCWNRGVRYGDYMQARKLRDSNGF